MNIAYFKQLLEIFIDGFCFIRKNCEKHSPIVDFLDGGCSGEILKIG